MAGFHPCDRSRMVFFGCRPWERAETEAATPEDCPRCLGLLPKDGKTYCAACHAIPGGEHLADQDDRAEREEELVTVGDTDGVTVREGITVPARYAKQARAG